MQRRHSQSAEFDDIPVLTDAIDEADDFPVLLDIDSTPTAFTAEAEQATVEMLEPVARPPSLDPGLLDILAHELARRVEQRIAAELPRIIESTVRDFLAEQEIIST
jgi:hypothetical protein